MNEFAFIEPARYRFLPGIGWGKGLEFADFPGVRVRGRKYTCLPDLSAVRRICLKAEKKGAGIIGFNPDWSVFGEKLKNELKIPLTAGLNYGVVRVLHDAAKKARAKGNNYGKLRFVVSFSGSSLARICTLILAERVKYLTLAGADEKILSGMAEELLQRTGTAVNLVTDMAKADGDIILDEKSFRPPDFLHWGFNEALILSLGAAADILHEGEALSVRKVEKVNSLAEKYGFVHYNI